MFVFEKRLKDMASRQSQNDLHKTNSAPLEHIIDDITPPRRSHVQDTPVELQTPLASSAPDAHSIVAAHAALSVSNVSASASTAPSQRTETDLRQRRRHIQDAHPPVTIPIRNTVRLREDPIGSYGSIPSGRVPPRQRHNYGVRVTSPSPISLEEVATSEYADVRDPPPPPVYAPSPIQRHQVIHAPQLGQHDPHPRPSHAELPHQHHEHDFPHSEDEYRVPTPEDAQFASPVWESTYVHNAPDEGTRLLPGRPLDHKRDDGDATANTSPESIDAAGVHPLHDNREFDDADFGREDPVFQKSVYMLGCSILTITSVVFVIVVSGLTTLISRRSVPRFTVYSDWPYGGVIPAKYGCHAPGGQAQSFPLNWQNAPATATSLVILFANPGSISAKGTDPVHWFVTDIPLRQGEDAVTSIPANASLNGAAMPKEAKQRKNVGSSEGFYYPPCPRNRTSLFVMHVYAVDASPVIGNFTDARPIMNRFVGVPTATFIGSYGRTERRIDVSPRPSNKSEPKSSSRGKKVESSSSRHRQSVHSRSFMSVLYEWARGLGLLRTPHVDGL